MELWLPLFFAGAMGLAMLIYVMLDGYDLGIGMLLPLAEEKEKDIMIASIGPFWDANETWLVLGVGILLVAFPEAHGIILTGLYMPVTIMLFGLILRGVAFDFRVKAGVEHRHMWNRLFFVGSFIASFAQGWMLGDYITGITDTTTNHLFSLLIALTLPAFYIMLGCAWLLMKTEDELFEKALHWGQKAVIPMGIGLLFVSIATPVFSTAIAEKWFTLPNAIGLMPIPLITVIVYGALFCLFYQKDILRKGYAWLVYVGLALISLLSTFGLAYSLYPDIVIGQMDIWDAAASTDSLFVIFIGAVVALPMILGYTIYIYKIFHGKATQLSYGADQ